MRALLLAVALLLVSASSASAGGLHVTASIAGAGSIGADAHIAVASPTCTQDPPAGAAQLLICPDYYVSSLASSITLIAAPATGWTFDSWSSCDTVRANVCELTFPAGLAIRDVAPVAHFADHRPPTVTAMPATVVKDAVAADWKADEAGVTYSCVVDGVTAGACAPPFAPAVAEGKHTVVVTATDMSGNMSVASIPLTVVDTELHGFDASTGIGTEIECSLDGGPWTRCGDKSGPLTLPPLADGEHTLRARGRAGSDVDPSPAARTWTIDTKAPDTFLRGFVLSSDEDGVSYKCRLDGASIACPALLGPLAPGAHTFEAVAVDRAGNEDPTPARTTWTVAEPERVTITVHELATLPAATPFTISYAVRNGKLTKLEVSGPAVTITVKHPHGRAHATTVAQLVGKRYPRGTRITVRSGAQSKTITLR